MFNDSCQTDYLKIYPTDFAKLSGLVELRLKMINLKLVFLDTSRDVATATNFCWLYLQK